MFGCSPDSEIKELKDIERIKSASNLKLYEEEKHMVRGLSVQYPLDYMCKEDLKKLRSFELGLYIVPDILFT